MEGPSSVSENFSTIPHSHKEEQGNSEGLDGSSVVAAECFVSPLTRCPVPVSFRSQPLFCPQQQESGGRQVTESRDASATPTPSPTAVPERQSGKVQPSCSESSRTSSFAGRGSDVRFDDDIVEITVEDTLNKTATPHKNTPANRKHSPNASNGKRSPNTSNAKRSPNSSPREDGETTNLFQRSVKFMSRSARSIKRSVENRRKSRKKKRSTKNRQSVPVAPSQWGDGEDPSFVYEDGHEVYELKDMSDGKEGQGLFAGVFLCFFFFFFFAFPSYISRVHHFLGEIFAYMTVF